MRKILKIGAALGICVSLFGGILGFSAPGDTTDPVVTKSYIVDVVVPQMKAYVDQKVGTGSGGGGAVFTVVNVPAGSTVYGEAGTEIILRMGQGTVIATSKGGLADTTYGYDLPNGTAMPSNHHLIVPVNDGRGFKAVTDVIVMVKGGYTLN